MGRKNQDRKQLFGNRTHRKLYQTSRTEREMLYKQNKKNIVPLDVWLGRIFPQDVVTKKKSGVKRDAEKTRETQQQAVKSYQRQQKQQALRQQRA